MFWNISTEDRSWCETHSHDGKAYDALKNEYDRQKRDGFCTYELDGYKGFVFANKNDSP